MLLLASFTQRMLEYPSPSGALLVASSKWPLALSWPDLLSSISACQDRLDMPACLVSSSLTLLSPPILVVLVVF